VNQKIILIPFILLILTSCKQVELPDIEIAGISSKDVEKALNTGIKIYNTAQDATPEQEYYIGRSVAASVLQKYKVYKKKDLNRYINSVGTILAVNSKQPEIFGGYHFAVLDSDEVNAFATPGGIIFVTRGMLRICNNEDELAAVLAHEIAHIQLKHGISSIKDSRWTSIATLIGTEAVKKYSSKELASLTESFEDSIGDVVNTLVVNGYSREYELQADEYAVDILNKSGYSQKAIISMLQKMSKRLQNDNRGFASTHPETSERIDALDFKVKKVGIIQKNRTNRFKTYMKNA